MTIYETIRADFIQSRKTKDGMAPFYSTLIGEMDNEASRAKSGEKSVTDELAIKVLKSFQKNLQEVQRVEKESNAFNLDTESELALVTSYLPKQMTKDELWTAVQDYIDMTGDDTMKGVMNHLKTKYAGLYDGKLAASVAASFV